MGKEFFGGALVIIQKKSDELIIAFFIAKT